MSYRKNTNQKNTLAYVHHNVYYNAWTDAIGYDRNYQGV